MTNITTEGRVFTAQLMRDIRNREKQGAGLFQPGPLTWKDAFKKFGDAFLKSGSPTKAGRLFAQGRERLFEAHAKHGACYINFYESRKRSGCFEIHTWKVAQHPMHQGSYEGILVSGHLCELRRAGSMQMWGRINAFVSWHALGRMQERWRGTDISDAAAMVGLIGIAGSLMSEGTRHANNEMNIAFEGVHCTGVMRRVPGKFHFFDCLTVLPDEPKYAKQKAQGAMVGAAVCEFIKGNNPDPHGYAKDIPVLPYTKDDYVTRSLAPDRASRRSMELHGAS